MFDCHDISAFSHLIKSFHNYNLREALFPSVGTRKSVVRPPFVVRSFVRRIIDFCEGDMEGASPLLSTSSLNFLF